MTLIHHFWLSIIIVGNKKIEQKILKCRISFRCQDLLTVEPVVAVTQPSYKNVWSKDKSISTQATIKWPSRRPELEGPFPQLCAVTWPYRCWQACQLATRSQLLILFLRESRPSFSQFTMRQDLCMCPRIQVHSTLVIQHLDV